MFKIPFPELREKILRTGTMNEAEFTARVKEKINELSGLITEEGAAHIIANELGISLLPKAEQLKIKEIYAGMRDVTTLGKVVRKFELRQFAKNGKEGKVRSFILGDETDSIRVVFWNDQTSLIEKVQENDVLLIKHCSVRENTQGKELHFGDRSELTLNPAGIYVTVARETNRYERKSIAEAKDNELVELVGTVVQVFDPRFFMVCSSCGKRVSEQQGNFFCSEHNAVQPEPAYVMNLILDDGTGNVRCVFWKQQSNHLLGKEEQQFLIYREQLSAFEEVKTALLGEQLKLLGRMKRNELFDRLELSVQLVERAKPEEEIARLEKVNAESVK